VEFQDVGEGLFVMDELSDGYGVKAELFRRGEKLPIAGVIDGDGANNNPNFKDLSLDEGTDLSLRMCYVEELWENVPCSDRHHAEA
jgi:hypothetical protein